MLTTARAGSDTTGTALANVFSHLLTEPAALASLQQEIAEAIPSDAAARDAALLAKLPFLQAVMCVPHLFATYATQPHLRVATRHCVSNRQCRTACSVSRRRVAPLLRWPDSQHPTLASLPDPPPNLQSSQRGSPGNDRAGVDV